MKSDHPNVMLCPSECHIESKEAKSNTEKLKYKLTFNSIKYITVITFRNMVLNSQTLQDKKNLLKKWESVFFSNIDDKLEFENYFAKNLYDSDNEMYMSWLPLKLGQVGGDKAFGFKKPTCMPKSFSKR